MPKPWFQIPTKGTFLNLLSFLLLKYKMNYLNELLDSCQDCIWYRSGPEVCTFSYRVHTSRWIASCSVMSFLLVILLLSLPQHWLCCSLPKCYGWTCIWPSSVLIPAFHVLAMRRTVCGVTILCRLPLLVIPCTFLTEDKNEDICRLPISTNSIWLSHVVRLSRDCDSFDSILCAVCKVQSISHLTMALTFKRNG